MKNIPLAGGRVLVEHNEFSVCVTDYLREEIDYKNDHPHEVSEKENLNNMVDGMTSMISNLFMAGVVDPENIGQMKSLNKAVKDTIEAIQNNL